MDIKIINNVLKLENISFDKEILKIKNNIEHITIEDINKQLKLNLKLNEKDSLNVINNIKLLIKNTNVFKKEIIKFLWNDILINYFDINQILINFFIFSYNNFLISNTNLLIKDLPNILKNIKDLIFSIFNNQEIKRKFEEFNLLLNNFLLIKNKIFLHIRYFIFYNYKNKLNLNIILNLWEYFSNDNNYISDKNNKLNSKKVKKFDISFFESEIYNLINFDKKMYKFIFEKINFKNININNIFTIFIEIINKIGVKIYFNNNECLNNCIVHKNKIISYIYDYFINYIKIDLSISNFNLLKFNKYLFILILIHLIDFKYLNFKISNKNNNLLEEITKNVEIYKLKLKELTDKKEIKITNNIINTLNSEIINLNKKLNIPLNINIDKDFEKKLLNIFFLYCKKQNLNKESYNNFDHYEDLQKNLKLNGLMQFIVDFNIKNLNKKKLKNNDILIIIKTKIRKKILNFNDFKNFLVLIFKNIFENDDITFLYQQIFINLNITSNGYLKNIKDSSNEHFLKPKMLYPMGSFNTSLINDNSFNQDSQQKSKISNKTSNLNIRNSMKKIQNSFEFEKHNFILNNGKTIAHNNSSNKVLRNKLNISINRHCSTINNKLKNQKLNLLSSLKLKIISKTKKFKPENSYFKIQKIKNINKYKNINNLNWNSVEKLKLNDFKDIINNPDEILGNLIGNKSLKNNNKDKINPFFKRQSDIKIKKNNLSVKILEKIKTNN